MSADQREPYDRRSATRVDPPHVRAVDAIIEDDALEAIADAGLETSPVATAQQIRLQAVQLATYLQRRQASVDHREGEVNARVAAMENQIRSARLWLDERHAELADLKTQLDRREQELSQRETRWQAPADQAADRVLAEREAELAQREAELSALAARFDQRNAGPDGHDELRRAALTLESYRADLKRAEGLLAAEQAELGQQRHALAVERAALADLLKAERRRSAAERQQQQADLQKQQQDLARHHEELAARQAALSRMRVEVTQAQHDTLELRLATEEVWSKLRGEMAPAALAQSLAQARLKLADEQRLAREELAAERAEVQRLVSRLSEQHERHLAERREVQAWVLARRQELEEESRSMATRERQLDDRQRAFDEQAAEWQRERARLHQEIRRLLRHDPPAQQAAA